MLILLEKLICYTSFTVRRNNSLPRWINTITITWKRKKRKVQYIYRILSSKKIFNGETNKWKYHI